MNFLNIVTLESAKESIGKWIRHIALKTECLDIGAAQGRYSAEDVRAEGPLPAFHKATVDGYAVKIKDVLGASESIPAMLTFAGEVKIGEAFTKPLQEGEAIYVPTGGMMPAESEAMVMIEYTELLDPNTVLVQKAVAYGDHILYAGDDLKKDALVIQKGTRIRPLDVGMLSGIGKAKVCVFEPIRATVISTGDEIVAPGNPIRKGQVFDINSGALGALLNEIGVKVVSKAHARDDAHALKEVLDQALANSDFVIISGGSSAGTRDFTQSVMTSYEGGHMLFHGLNVKPGKPTMASAIDGKLVFGLPGHPMASALIFQELIKPFVEGVYGHKPENRQLLALLQEQLHAAPGKVNFVPVDLMLEEGVINARPLLGKSSVFSVLSSAAGYIVIPSDKEGLLAGEKVWVKPLK